MSRSPILPVLAMVLLAAPGMEARADQLNGGVIGLKLKLPPERGTGEFAEPTAEYLLNYFNGARCACDVGGTQQLYRIEYTWARTPDPVANHEIDIWTGIGCESALDTERETVCTHQPSISDPDDLARTVKRDYRVKDLVLRPGTLLCPDTDETGEHWAVTESGATWDETNRDHLANATLMTEGVRFDMEPPPLPTALTAQALESGIRLTWNPITSNQSDIDVFQALCSRADGSVAHETPTVSRRYETPRTLCGSSTDIDVPAAVLTNPLGPATGTLPVPLRQLDETFLCGQSEGLANGIELTGLKDGVSYWVVLLSVDDSGNVAATHVDRPLTPVPVTDFWEELNEEDGYVQGGFCVSQVGSDGAIGGAVLVALAGVIAARRRRRRGARLAKIALLGLVLVPGVASAQSSFSPHWIDEEQDSVVGATEPTWTLGIRFGPYRPSVDDNFESNPGPYARTFLKDSYMLAVDVHRVWSLARGQAGFGITSGYFSNSALAFENGTTRDTPNRPRADGNLTRLSVVPIQLTAIYRATIFDDEMGIPLVPYARAGLGYYLWWAKAPSDELSVAMSCPTCSDKAIGGTIGIVAAAGLAIRAERIDADAARSMQDSGLEHAGFYAEVEGSWISGFGNKTKLSVGDLTWFGGISFEF